jgi:RHS repeat-associated protein
MPDRTYNSTALRYTFNGKEDEIFSEWQDYGFRNYDKRQRRFTSVDPLTAKYPWYTPYQFAGNMPIWATDLDGLEEHISTNFHSDGRITALYRVTAGSGFTQIAQAANQHHPYAFTQWDWVRNANANKAPTKNYTMEKLPLKSLGIPILSYDDPNNPAYNYNGKLRAGMIVAVPMLDLRKESTAIQSYNYKKSIVHDDNIGLIGLQFKGNLIGFFGTQALDIAFFTKGPEAGTVAIYLTQVLSLGGELNVSKIAESGKSKYVPKMSYSNHNRKLEANGAINLTYGFTALKYSQITPESVEGKSIAAGASYGFFNSGGAWNIDQSSNDIKNYEYGNQWQIYNIGGNTPSRSASFEVSETILIKKFNLFGSKTK